VVRVGGRLAVKASVVNAQHAARGDQLARPISRPVWLPRANP
jgi:hypothetical protein